MATSPRTLKTPSGILVETPEGFKDPTGKIIIYPQGSLMHDSEYQAILDATKAGKSLSEAKNKQIQANMDLRAKMRDEMQSQIIKSRVQQLQSQPTIATGNNPLNGIPSILNNLSSNAMGDNASNAMWAARPKVPLDSPLFKQ